MEREVALTLFDLEFKITEFLHKHSSANSFANCLYIGSTLNKKSEHKHKF